MLYLFVLNNTYWLLVFSLIKFVFFQTNLGRPRPKSQMILSKVFSKTGFGESDTLRCSIENYQKCKNENFTLSIWTHFEDIDVHKKSSLFVYNLSRLQTKKRHQVIAQIYEIITYVETISTNRTNLHYHSKCKKCFSARQN